MQGKRKFQQLKSYSKIMKLKKQTGEVVQFKVPSSKDMEEEDKQYTSKDQPVQEEVGSLKQEDYEDQFSDEFSDEEAWIDDEDSSQNDNAQQGNQMIDQKTQNTLSKKGGKQEEKQQVFIGTNKQLKKGEILDFDNNAYDMLHRLNIEWPSLSIDFVAQDSPFSQLRPFQTMKQYPFQVFTVQGSCNNTKNNTIYLTKWSKLHRTKFDSDPDAVNEDEGNNDEEAEVLVQEIPTSFNVNRLRSLKNSPIVAFWNEVGEINIMDLTQNYEKLRNGIGTKKKSTTIDQNIKLIKLKSDSEGYAINWNPHKVGQLATGNTSNIVQIFENNQNYTAWQKTLQYNYHKGSVEDIVFSPTQETVFASCSADGTLQIVDMRVGKFDTSQICVFAHKKDVNVCDWNKIATHLIVTGSDDCSVKVWDLRMCAKSKGKNSEQLLAFKWHSEPITSIKFQPNEESSVAVASEDNSITLWDMSVENQQQDPDIPNQLMFIHQGQEQIKQLAFHPIYFQMIVSSALDGINIFKPSFEMPEQMDEGEQDLKHTKPIPEHQLDKYLERMSLND